jgi:hypothetical protein
MRLMMLGLDQARSRAAWPCPSELRGEFSIAIVGPGGSPAYCGAVRPDAKILDLDQVAYPVASLTSLLEKEPLKTCAVKAPAFGDRRKSDASRYRGADRHNGAI